MFHIRDINEHLDTDEKVILFFRPSRKAYLLQYIVWLGLLITSLIIIGYAKVGASSNLFIMWKFVEYFSSIAMFITLFVLIRMEYRIWSRRYALTDERILYSRGIFQEVFKSLSYSYITDIEFVQTFWDKLMNTGTLAINTAGAQDYEIRYRKVNHPLKIKKMINNMQTEQNTSGTRPQIHKNVKAEKKT